MAGSRMEKFMPRFVGGLILLFIVFMYVPFPGVPSAPRDSRSPLPEDSFILPERSHNLLRPFPAMPVRSDNSTSAPKVELGRLLFFDPILSGGNTISCAHCHHPDLGFSDNRGQSMGKGGEGIGPQRTGGIVLRRGSPTIWNAAYNQRQFWDGRAIDLEDQAQNPIQDKNEMAQDSTELVRELKAIPRYARQFANVFGDADGSAVTFRNVTYAVAAFEQTILSQNSRFDQYARGDRNVLTSTERRGLNLFRSLKTRCFECHNFPTFANPDFKVVGVPDLDASDPDLGRGEISTEAYNRSFKVPTLRNIALTAPYMHNGIFTTLGEVIDFYSDGGGRGRGLHVPNVDDKIRKLNLTSREKTDLIAFLHTLTDESAKPELPQSVPSGLTVVPKLENQSPELAVYKREDQIHSPSDIAREGHRLLVAAGESIQDAIDLAQSGDTVLVQPGTYYESLTLDVSGVTLMGVEEGGRRPILDGEHVLSDGLVGSASDVEIRRFAFRNYTSNGVMINGGRNVTFRDLYLYDTGLYGVYPVECAGVLIERCEVTKVRDAGLYVGQSKDIVVRGSIAHGNVTGIEIENCVNAVVENNEIYNNSGGILVFLLPNNPSKVSRNCLVRGNRVHDNNHVNFADPTAIVSSVPSGTGILIMAADEVEVTDNEITGNNSYGIGVVSLEMVLEAEDGFDVDPVPERCWIHDNIYDANGTNPHLSLVELGFPGADLLWDLSGHGNSWDEPDAVAMPPILPGKAWSPIARRANWRLWKILEAVTE